MSRNFVRNSTKTKRTEPPQASPFCIRLLFREWTAVEAKTLGGLLMTLFPNVVS